MKIAIMQPYLFPYLGYFQLINAVDKLIIYDDVNYIKQGWINRNTILVNKAPYMFTLPIENSSSFRKINSIRINSKLYYVWLNKFLKTVEQNYRKAPFFNDVFPILMDVFKSEDGNQKISYLASKSLKKISGYLGLTTEFEETSSKYNNQNLTSQERVLDICMLERADHYINLIGGLELYSKKTFLEKGIALKFIKTNDISYKQFDDEFLANLSIIDVLMFNDIQTIKEFLNNYELI